MMNRNEYTANLSINMMKSADEYAVADNMKDKLIAKTITENGEYNASADDADGYSKVNVNVVSMPSEIAIMTSTRDSYYGSVDIEYIYAHDNTSVYVLEDTLNPHWGSSNKTFVMIHPLKKLVYTSSMGSTPSVYFTPTEDYEGFFTADGTKYTTTGTVTAGDGKTYRATLNYPQFQSASISAFNADYVPILKS